VNLALFHNGSREEEIVSDWSFSEISNAESCLYHIHSMYNTLLRHLPGFLRWSLPCRLCLCVWTKLDEAPPCIRPEIWLGAEVETMCNVT